MVFEKLSAVSLKIVPKLQLASIDDPLLYCTEVESETTKQKYDVNGSFILLCLLRSSFEAALFSTTDLHVKNFIANAVLSAF